MYSFDSFSNFFISEMAELLTHLLFSEFNAIYCIPRLKIEYLHPHLHLGVTFVCFCPLWWCRCIFSVISVQGATSGVLLKHVVMEAQPLCWKIKALVYFLDPTYMSQSVYFHSIAQEIFQNRSQVRQCWTWIGFYDCCVIYVLQIKNILKIKYVWSKSWDVLMIVMIRIHCVWINDTTAFVWKMKATYCIWQVVVTTMAWSVHLWSCNTPSF